VRYHTEAITARAGEHYTPVSGDLNWLEGDFSPRTISVSTHHPQPSTLNPEPSTLNPQPSTLNPQPKTLNPQTTTLNPQPQNQ